MVPDRDFFSCAESEIADTTSLLTMVGGKVVYGAGPFAAHDEGAPPPAMPDWSPVRRFGGYARLGRQGGRAAAEGDAQGRVACGCANDCNVHGHGMRRPGPANCPCRPQELLGRARLRLLGGLTMREIASPVLRWVALLLLCAAYLQGGLQKALDFPSAIAEMNHFGLSPAAPLAVAVIVLELGASALILVGRLALAGRAGARALHADGHFRGAAFWEMPAGPARFGATNSFFEHLGLVGGFLLVAWHDLRERTDG